jgi:hypothetical protein
MKRGGELGLSKVEELLLGGEGVAHSVPVTIFMSLWITNKFYG